MQNAPKELLLELLKYSGAISQPKIKFWVSHSQSLGRYHVHVLIPEKGLRGHEFVIAVVNQIEHLKQFIRDTLSLKFSSPHSVQDGDLVLYTPFGKSTLNQTHPYILPLDTYGETIKKEFKRIAQEFDVQEN